LGVTKAGHTSFTQLQLQCCFKSAPRYKTRERVNTAGALSTHEEEENRNEEDWVRRVQSGTVAEPRQGRSKRLWSVFLCCYQADMSVATAINSRVLNMATFSTSFFKVWVIKVEVTNS